MIATIEIIQKNFQWWMAIFEIIYSPFFQIELAYEMTNFVRTYLISMQKLPAAKYLLICVMRVKVV